MRILVTGVAGFIASSTAERLLERGHSVTGMDCFTDYYARDIKEKNIQLLKEHPDFNFLEQDILAADLGRLLGDADAVFHAAAQAGVRASWGRDFDIYVRNNIQATQALLEAARETATPRRFVYASSSSVYGDAVRYPVTEDLAPQPVSPYGVSKLAAEHLCRLYWKNHGIPTVSLRYFTVYGPRQRPDMGFHKFIRAMLSDQELVIYGNGEQTRDFTFIADAVAANVAALEAPDTVAGLVCNIGGGDNVTLNQALEMLESITGKKAVRRFIEKQKGDVVHTFADISRAREALNFEPKVKLEQGLAEQVAWMEKQKYESRHSGNISR